MGSNATAQPNAQSLPPGALFGIPGFTQYTEQKDNNDGFVVNLSQSGQSGFISQGGNNFKQTDVVFWWEMDLSWTNTVTPGTGTATASPYFPWNVIGPTKLSVQNMFNPIDVQNGIDMMIFQSYRPMRSKQNDARNNMYSNPAANWQTSTLAQANIVQKTGETTATTPVPLSLELPASLFFDCYYHLDKMGNPVQGVMQPQRAIVSPIYMSSSARFVQPQITYNPLAGNNDTSPYVLTGNATAAGSVTHAFRRVGVYGSGDPRVLPPVMNPWQYQRKSVQFGLAGVTQKDIPLASVSNPGQILSVFLRLFDPTANAPINITQVSEVIFQYGSGLIKFDDTPVQCQRRFLAQHGFLPPQGVLVWDLATDNYGRITNGANILNTLITAGVNVHVNFVSALSANAYCYVGVESLVVVE